MQSICNPVFVPPEPLPRLQAHGQPVVRERGGMQPVAAIEGGLIGLVGGGGLFPELRHVPIGLLAPGRLEVAGRGERHSSPLDGRVGLAAEDQPAAQRERAGDDPQGQVSPSHRVCTPDRCQAGLSAPNGLSLLL